MCIHLCRHMYVDTHSDKYSVRLSSNFVTPSYEVVVLFRAALRSRGWSLFRVGIAASYLVMTDASSDLVKYSCLEFCIYTYRYIHA